MQDDFIDTFCEKACEISIDGERVGLLAEQPPHDLRVDQICSIFFKARPANPTDRSLKFFGMAQRYILIWVSSRKKSQDHSYSNSKRVCLLVALRGLAGRERASERERDRGERETTGYELFDRHTLSALHFGGLQGYLAHVKLPTSQGPP